VPFVIEQLKPVDLGILIAAAVMALGAFCPIISLPILVTLNYVMRGNGDGIIIVGCSAAIIALTVCGYRRLSAVPAASALLMMVVTLARFAALLSKAQSEAAATKSKAFGGLASLMINSVGLEWGWVLLFGGAFGVLALALLGPRPGASSSDTPSKAAPESESFSSADRIIAEYLEKRQMTSPSVPCGGQKPGFGKRTQSN
jgi:hypothetical protein